MKKKLFKKSVLALAFIVVITTALAGCGQTAENLPNSTSQNGSSENSREVSLVDEDSETTTPETTEEIDVPSESNDTTTSTETPVSDETTPEDTTPTDTPVSDESTPEDTTPTDTPASDEITPEETTTPDASTPLPVSTTNQTTNADRGNLSGIELNVQFGDSETFTMHLYNNDTATKIAEHVGTAAWRLPIYHYDDYANWEVMQYYDIPSRYEIPSNPETITSEKAGTVYYSEPNRIVLFYQDAEISSEYTPVGYIDYTQDFVDAVVNNPVVEGWGNKLVHISMGD